MTFDDFFNMVKNSQPTVDIKANIDKNTKDIFKALQQPGAFLPGAFKEVARLKKAISNLGGGSGGGGPRLPGSGNFTTGGSNGPTPTDTGRQFDSHVAIHKAVKAYEQIKEKLNEIKDEYKKMANTISKIANKFTAPFKKMLSGLKGVVSGTKSMWSKITGIFKKGAKDCEKATSGLSLKLKDLLKTALSFVSIYGLINIGKQAIVQSGELAQSEAKLAALMKQRMGATNDTIKAVKQLASEQAKLGVVSEAAMVKGAEQLSMYVHSAKALETLMPAIANMTARRGGFNATPDDAMEIATQLGEAIREGTTTPLEQSGIYLSEAEIKKFQALRTEEERANFLAAQIAKNVGNINEALANTPHGQIAQLKNNFKSLLGTLGTLLVNVIQPIVKWLNVIVVAANNALKALGELLGFDMSGGGLTGIGDVGTGTAPDTGGIDDVGDSLDDAKDSAEEAEKAVEKFKGSLMGFDEINILSDNTNKDTGSEEDDPTNITPGEGGQLTPGFDPTTITEGENIFTKFGEKIKAFMDEVLEPFKAAWDLLGERWKKAWADLLVSFKNFCDSLASFLKSVWDNGGKEFVQHMAEIALAVGIAAAEIGGTILDALAKLWDHLDPEKNMHTQRLLDVLNEVSQKLRDFILGLNEHLENLLKYGGQDVLNAMGDCFMDLAAAAVNAFGVIIDAIDGLIDHLDPKFNENTRNMLQALADMFHAVGEAAWDFSELLRSALENGGQDMINAFGDMLMNLGQATAEVITTMMESFSKFFEYIDPATNDITRNMMKAWEEAFLAIGQAALGFSELFDSIMNNGGQEVLNKLGDAFNSLVTLVGVCVKEIADALNGLFEHLDPKTNEFTQGMLKAWQDAFDGISGMAKDIGEVLSSVMDNGGQDIVNAIGDLGMQILETFGNVVEEVADCVGSLFKHLDPAENKIAKGALESFEYFINSIRDFVGMLGDALGTFMDNGGQEFVNNMGDIIALLVDLGLTITADLINAVTTFMDSWLGHAVISACATALELISEVLKGLLEILEPLSPIISGVVAAFAGFQVASKVVGFISSIVSAFQALGGAGGILALVKGGFTALWAVLSANPIAAIVAAIVGIGVAIVALYNKCEGFREFIDKILAGFQDLFNELKEHFSALLEDVRNIFGNVIDIITGIFEGDGEKVGEAVRNLIINLVDLMMDMNKAFVEVGWALIKGLVQGIWECIKALPSLLAGFLEFVVDFFKGLFGIHSPSTVFAELGVNLIEGLVKGILDSINSVTEAFKKIGDAIFGTIKDIAKTVSDKFKEIKDGIKDRLKETKEVVSEKWKEIKETVSEKAKATYEVAKENWANIKDTVSEKSKEAYNAIKENWKEVKQTATDIFTETYNVTKEKWADIKDTVKERAKETYEAAKDNWTNLKQNTTDRFKDIYDTVKDKFTNIRDTVKEKATKTFEDVSASWTKIKDDAATKLEQIKTDAEKRYNDVKNVLVNKIEEAKKGIIEKWEEVKNKTNECIENVRQTSEEKYNEIKETIVERLEDIKSNTEKKWEEIKKNTGTAVENIKKEAETQYAKIKDSLVDILEKTKSAMATKWDSIKSDAVSKVSTMANEVSNKFAEIKTKLSSKLDEVKSTLSSKWESIKTQTSNAASKISTSAATAFDGISSKASKALDSARTSVSNGLSKITSLFKNTSWSLPKIKLPHFKISGSFSLNPPKVPSFSVEWYKRGGIIDGITPLGMTGGTMHMAGEAGKEMVVPLENTSFTSKIAQAMGQAVDNAMARNYNNMNNNNNSTNENRDVVLQLDGREFARASINQINKLQRESGRTLLDV
jgi:phage-related protein